MTASFLSFLGGRSGSLFVVYPGLAVAPFLVTLEIAFDFFRGESFAIVSFFDALKVFLSESFVEIEIPEFGADLCFLCEGVPHCIEGVIADIFGPEHTIDFPVDGGFKKLIL